MKDFIGIILAAGQGVRMKSNLPKLLHNICGRPMVDYVIEAIRDLHLRKVYVVVNKRQEQLISYLKQNKGLKFIFQRKPLGTADAVKSAKGVLGTSKANTLIICADVPLLRKETLKSLMNKHKDTQSSCTILTAYLNNPSGYGRILRDEFSKVCRIIEENDATVSLKEIKEINSGIYCFKTKDLLEALNQVEINTKKQEFYLTDIVEILYQKGRKIDTYDCLDASEVFGINSQLGLSRVNDVMRLRIIEEFMQEGVRIISPQTTFIDHGSLIGKDTIIYPFTFIESNVKIGQNCSIGPFCRLRKGTVIKDNNKIGNFTEISRTSLGKGTYFKHFGYLGDATVGENVNIGAGTVIANYDGKNKNPTVIKDKSFIGCDTVIIAPAKIGKGAVTGAGSVITKSSNIKDNSVVAGVPARPLLKTSKIVGAKRKAKKPKRKKR